MMRRWVILFATRRAFTENFHRFLVSGGLRCRTDLMPVLPLAAVDLASNFKLTSSCQVTLPRH